MRQELLTAIDAYCNDNGLSRWQFGELAVGDRHFVNAFRNGRNIRIDTLERVRAQLATRPEQTPPSEAVAS